MTRKEAIENIEILKEDYWDDDGYGHETKQYDDTMLALDMAIKALEQQEPRWIPVSEGLPEEHGRYLVSFKQGYVTTDFWVGNIQKWKEITAWMPLPKSYSEVESEG